MTRDERQRCVKTWMVSTFGENITDGAERGLRILEEASELAQALGVTQDQAVRVLSKTFSRPVGDIAQEIGGVSLTLLALGATLGISVDGCEVAEIERVHRPEVVERAKRRDAENRRDGTSTS